MDLTGLACFSSTIIVGLGALLIWFGWMYRKVAQASRQLDEQMQREGHPIEAEIVNRRLVTRSRGATTYFITCRYTIPSAAASPDAAPRVLMQEVTVTGVDYRHLKLGDTLTLTYLPSQPQTVRIASGARDALTTGMWSLSARIAIIVGVGIVLLGVYVLVALPSSVAPRAPRPTSVPDPRGTSIAATATMQADEKELARLKSMLTPRFEGWRSVTDRKVHRLRQPETGDGRVIEINYGYCEAGQFYVYAWYHAERFDVGAVYNVFLKGYGYVDGASPETCFPSDYVESVWLRNAGVLGAGWYAMSGAIEQPKATPIRR